ncbi:hypothetical protein [Kitasatospora sp. GP82]|uniref:glycoside hydrolase family 16 protein n=1 Tax=Kitasatospora sp. GP82 TaxID=3035089 RepID=UPI002476E288|nr:hypothetical protein [Kitasatospora sp. GP82]MDH6129499.1 hypothetical protein [Kitasatospora sp. GP82]
MHARIRIAMLAVAALFALALPYQATAISAVTVTQDSLTPTTAVPGSPTTATLKLHSSACITVLQVGVAVRDSAGNNYDFPGAIANPLICPSGYTLTTGSRTFPAGTYTESGFYLDATGYHNLTQVTLTVASSGTPGDPTRGKTLTFAEEFNSPITYGSRWVAGTTSAYQYGTHNPNDDKLDWLNPANITYANGLASFTAQPSTHTLENGKQAWNTGLLTTEGSTQGFQIKTGDYIETSVSMPSGLGAWPALWSWKNGDTEVDKFEYHPDNPNLLELTNHVNAAQDYYTNSGAVGPNCFVKIGAVYGATSVDWYVNGVKVFSDGKGVGTSFSAYIILNLSVDAGTWHPAPSNSNPISFSADYVHVWR